MARPFAPGAPVGKRTLVLLVGGGLLVPALLLSLLGVKLLRDFTAITRGVQSDYGAYMARVASTSLENAFWEEEQVNMVAARLVPPENPEQVVRFLNSFVQQDSLYRQAFFVSPVGLVYYSEGAQDPEFRPVPDWVLIPIMEFMGRHTAMPSELVHLTSPDPAHPAQVTYFTVQSVTGELLGAAGFVWDLGFVKRDRKFLDRVLVHRLDADSDVFRGALTRSEVDIVLLDDEGRAFYSTAELDRPRVVATRAFDRVLPFYKVAVGLSDPRFEAWVRNVVVTHLAIIVTMFLVIVAAVAFSLRFMLHEMELAELKSAFVSNVSHELKTPLSLIRLFSETLEMDRASDRAQEKEFLRIIHKESDRLTHLIDNVLDVGRIEQGRKTYRFAPTDLARVVRETLAAYDFQLRKQGFTVESNIDRALPEVPADGDAVTQALLNLMDNAIKYSPRERYLKVELGRENGDAVIAVEDRGVGIPPREQAKIFEKFYRVEKSLVHDVKGSGLGLSLVKHIVDAHGGRIRVDSRPGEGSRFSILLPLGGPPSGKDRENREGRST